jgi:site-specific recombinase XerD
MLVALFPRVHRRYSTLAILGPILGDYAAWLFAHGYPEHRVLMHLRTARRLEPLLVEQGVHGRTDLNRDRLSVCGPVDSQEDCELSALVRSLGRYLEASGAFAPRAATFIEQKATIYHKYLTHVRGFAPTTAKHHMASIAEFLGSLGYEADPARLAKVVARDIEDFVRALGKRMSRASLQHVVAHMRAFLRFLAASGEIAPGLDVVIDTPRLYRGERLPRALPWSTVRALLRSIDTSDVLGRRDYAMLLLVATYGLRTCDIVAMKLDDIDWRGGTFRIGQQKTATPMLLPLTDDVGAAIVAYLRDGRPTTKLREVFLRERAPAGVLKPTAVTEAFQAWSRRSGLAIPYQGPHCLRHSVAVHLLREGAPLKTIGDLLGHRSAEATCVYLRLAVEDLRDVALPLPVSAPTVVREVRP